MKLLERLKPIHYLLATILIFGVLFVTNGVPFIYSDGYGSYHTTQCLIKEHSWACSKEPEYIDYTEHTVSLYQDKYVTVYSPGSALFNLPGQIIANALKGEKTIDTDLYMATNGHTILAGSMFILTAFIVSILSLVLIYKALRNFQFSERLSLFSTGVAFLSSYAVWYAFLYPAFNHTYEILGLSVLLYGLSLNKDKSILKSAIIVSLGVGIAFLSRPTFASVGVIVSFSYLLKKDFKSLLIYCVGLVPFIGTWISYNYISYGKFIASGYSVLWNETFVSQFNGLNILFSGYRGWFIYSPLAIVAVVGLLMFIKKNKSAALISLLSVLSTIIIYGFWDIWWGGGGYGQRFLIAFIPFVALGTAVVLANKKVLQFKKYIYILVILLTLWSMLLTFFYRFTPVTEIIPKSNYEGLMPSGDRYTPIDIYKYQVDLIKNSTSIKDYLKNFINSSNGGTSYVPLFLNMANNVIKVNSTSDGFELISLSAKNSRNAFPESIKFFLKQNDNVYLYSLSLNNKNTIIFNCISTCSTNDSEVSIEQQTNYPQLQKNEYSAFHIDNNIQNYFKNESDLTFSGNKIELTWKEQYYSL